MKHRKTLLLLLLFSGTFLLYNFIEEKETAKSVLTKTKNKYESHRSVSYTILYKQKFFDGADTVKIKASCKLIREKKDSLFGGKIWFLTIDSAERYYDLNKLYTTDHPAKKITEYDPHKGEIWPVTGNTAGQVRNTFFMKPERLIEEVNDSTTKTVLSEDIKSGHYIITFFYQDDAEFSDSKRTLWIRKKDLVIDKINYQIKFQGLYQYNEWNLSNIEFDKVSEAELATTIQKNKSYTKEKYAEHQIDYSLLPVGAKAPAFTATNSATGKTLSLNDYVGKTVILDFFYMACMPCIKAIPHLSKLFQEHEKDVVVLGINSTDVGPEKKERIPEFIKVNKMAYPFTLTSRQTDSLYKVKGYPTLYVINKKGEVAFTTIGFSETLHDTLNTVLQNLK